MQKQSAGQSMLNFAFAVAILFVVLAVGAYYIDRYTQEGVAFVLYAILGGSIFTLFIVIVVAKLINQTQGSATAEVVGAMQAFAKLNGPSSAHNAKAQAEQVRAASQIAVMNHRAQLADLQQQKMQAQQQLIEEQADASLDAWYQTETPAFEEYE